MTGAPGDIEVDLITSDGWRLGALLTVPPAPTSPVPAVVLVHGSRHERDAYGASIPSDLAANGVAALRFDIRGRGTSRDPVAFHRMAPGQRRRVALDVAAALEHLGSRPDIDGARIAVAGEQDTAAATVEAAAADERVVALVLLSARMSKSAVAAIAGRPVPVLGLVSREDRAGLRGTVDAYLASAERGSRIEVFSGLGFGTTMFSSRKFEHPGQEPLETMIVDWIAQRLVGDRPRH